MSQTAETPLSVAIVAMGGQGGGVLSDWIVAVAEARGWHAQSTSVPGVAQRTGATLYYIEMLPPKDGKTPVFALMPTPGDVDVVIAAELMEAGRSILRGLVTPDKTLLITSTHRAYAVAEKEKPGYSIGDPQAVDAATGITARRIIAFDMDSVAKTCGTVISSPLLGALAGSGALPFARDAFETVIKSGGKGAANSLRAFDEGFARAGANELSGIVKQPPKTFDNLPRDSGHPALDGLLGHVRAFPAPLHAMIFAGLKRVVDYQDVAYGEDYLSRLDTMLAADRKAGGEAKGFVFAETTSKYLASAMAYDDVIGVADAKTRLARFDRIQVEMGAGANQPLYLTEFMHPRAEELIGLLPAGFGRAVGRRPRLVVFIDRIFNKGRRIETAKIRGFLQLYALSALKPYRRRLLRHANEMAHLDNWLSLATRHLGRNYDLAVGVISARRLVKGYSDTHARGVSKFDRVVSAVPHLAARADAGEWMSRLIKAALQDEDGEALDGVLKTIATL
jgi:indolepyruvate ferredoxin oxidoreductase, beta subunit